jgi:hypothetical protein
MCTMQIWVEGRRIAGNDCVERRTHVSYYGLQMAELFRRAIDGVAVVGEFPWPVVNVVQYS